ncbi:MAG: cyclic nucleotide-gated ion channel [Parvibaculaceae bacterium]
MSAIHDRAPPASLLARSPSFGSIARAFLTSWRWIAGSAALLLALIVFSGALLHFAESHLRPESYGSIVSAVRWMAVSLFTIGYGDVPPVTTFGRVVAGGTIVLGILILAAPVTAVWSCLRNRAERHDFVVTFSMVATVPLFQSLDATSIARLVEILTAFRVPAGSRIVSKGDSADGMFFIAAGEVKVELPHGDVRLGPGEFFGEIALLMPNPKRTANVVSVTACDLLKLSSREFERLLGAQDHFTEQIGLVARRRLNELLAEQHTT